MGDIRFGPAAAPDEASNQAIAAALRGAPATAAPGARGRLFDPDARA